MLKDLLNSKKGFKLVCGAGNEDVIEVEKLVTIYSLAGCRFFDISANTDIVDATKRGLARSKKDKESYICISVGIAGDPHITKANIDSTRCIKCESCISICKNEAISKNIKIIKERCLGCGQCEKICHSGAISMKTKLQDYNEILPELIKKNIDCIEFHAISTNEFDVDEKWQIINNNFDGMLCISLDRSELGDKKLLERVKRLIKNRKPYTTIIQADGVAMSGNDDEYGTTLQAVATAQLFQNANLPVYIMMSGGTNTKSIKLANTCGVYPHCLAVGSYARKIVKEFLRKEDLLENPIELNKAVEIARKLIEDTVGIIND